MMHHEQCHDEINYLQIKSDTAVDDLEMADLNSIYHTLLPKIHSWWGNLP